MRIETNIDGRVELYLEINRAVMLRGLPGTGKTSLLEHLAQKNGWEVVFYQATPGSTEEDMLYKVLPDDTTKSGVKVVEGVLPKALKLAKEGKKVLLIIDEVDKTRPSFDAFLLDFLQNFRVSVPGFEISLEGKEIENIYVGLTSNDTREFQEALLRRVAVVELPPLPSQVVKQILELKHKNNPYLLNAVRLYELTLAGELSKPATVQELDRLLTALEKTNYQADWNTLVRELVVKTDDDWELLLEAIERYGDEPIRFEGGTEREQPNLSAFEVEPNLSEKFGKVEIEPKLPRPIIPKYETPQVNLEETLKRATLVVKKDEKSLAKALELVDFDLSKVKTTNEIVAVEDYQLKIENEGELGKLSALEGKFSEGEVSLKFKFDYPIKELMKIFTEDKSFGIKDVQQIDSVMYVYAVFKDAGEIFAEGLFSGRGDKTEAEIVANVKYVEEIQKQFKEVYEFINRKKRDKEILLRNLKTITNQDREEIQNQTNIPPGISQWFEERLHIKIPKVVEKEIEKELDSLTKKAIQSPESLTFGEIDEVGVIDFYDGNFVRNLRVYPWWEFGFFMKRKLERFERSNIMELFRTSEIMRIIVKQDWVYFKVRPFLMNNIPSEFNPEEQKEFFNKLSLEEQDKLVEKFLKVFSRHSILGGTIRLTKNEIPVDTDRIPKVLSELGRGLFEQLKTINPEMAKEVQKKFGEFVPFRLENQTLLIFNKYGNNKLSAPNFIPKIVPYPFNELIPPETDDFAIIRNEQDAKAYLESFKKKSLSLTVNGEERTFFPTTTDYQALYLAPQLNYFNAEKIAVALEELKKREMSNKSQVKMRR